MKNRIRVPHFDEGHIYPTFNTVFILCPKPTPK